MKYVMEKNGAKFIVHTCQHEITQKGKFQKSMRKYINCVNLIDHGNIKDGNLEMKAD